MIPNFNIATDVKIEMYLPINIINPFIIGVSILGGSDVLDGDIFPETDWEWVNVEATVARASITTGGSIKSNLYFQPETGSLQVELQTYDFDPSVNSAVRAGTKIRFRLDDGIVNTILFDGFIDTIDVSYFPKADKPNLIRITALDSFKRFVNTRIPIFDTTDPVIYPAGYATPKEVFEIVSTVSGVPLSSSSDNIPGKIPSEYVENAIASQFVNEAIKVGLGICWIDPETSELILKNRPTITTSAPPGTYTIGNNHGEPYHLCLSDLTVTSDADASFNSLKAILKSDETIFVVKQDVVSIDLYGETSQDEIVNTTDSTELDRWATDVFNQSPTKLVREVTTPSIDRTGTLTAAAAFQPGTLIKVDFQRSPLDIETYYNVTRVRHQIDVDNWFTTLELWKEV